MTIIVLCAGKKVCYLRGFGPMTYYLVFVKSWLWLSSLASPDRSQMCISLEILCAFSISGGRYQPIRAEKPGHKQCQITGNSN